MTTELISDGEVIVQAADIRKMMDYYQRAVSCHFKNKESDRCYERLWDALKAKESMEVRAPCEWCGRNYDCANCDPGFYEEG